MDLSWLRKLVEIDSPSGFTHAAADFIEESLREIGLTPQRTAKGAVRAVLGDAPPRLAVMAHFDTIGAVVSSVTENGTLRISPVGGLNAAAFDGCYVRVYTHRGSVYTGTFLLDNPSTHASRIAHERRRTFAHMHIRVDELVRSARQVRELGINEGDFVCFHPNYEETPAGFVKSRFMDNKSGCFVAVEAARRVMKAPLQPSVEFFFSNYEEVGHGGAFSFPASVEEVIVIDMGVVGDHVPGEEGAVSICAKDSSGPYDYEMRREFVDLARQHGIPHVVSVYPFYRSDGSAALLAGNDFRVALIGPGVSASHGMERVHKTGIQATIDLVVAAIERRAKH